MSVSSHAGDTVCVTCWGDVCAAARETSVPLMRSMTSRCRRLVVLWITSSLTRWTPHSAALSTSNNMASALLRSLVLTRWNDGRQSVTNRSPRTFSFPDLYHVSQLDRPRELQKRRWRYLFLCCEVQRPLNQASVSLG